MEIKYLQVLVMPNREVIYKGTTIGFVNEDVSRGSVEPKHLFSESEFIKK